MEVTKKGVSVCISVYNSANFLNRSLETVAKQTLEDMEIVLVNNGSTDNSPDIMREFQKRYPNKCIKIIDQENRGLAQGRQSGVNAAECEYIAFLDADDLIDEDTYRKSYVYAIEHDLDIVDFGTQRGERVIMPSYVGEWNARELFCKYMNGDSELSPMLWMRLYRRELFKALVFPNMFVNNEDIFAFPCLLFAAKTIGFMHEVLHTYSIDNDDAIMTKLKNNPEYAEGYRQNRIRTLLAPQHVQTFLGENAQEYAREIQYFERMLIVNYIFTDIYGVSLKNKLNDVIDTLKYKDAKDVLKSINTIKTQGDILFKMISVFGVKNTYYLRRIYLFCKEILK